MAVLQGRLAPSKGASDTRLKLTWLADVRTVRRYPICTNDSGFIKRVFQAHQAVYK